MGLDLVVEGSPKSGHEQEWRKLLQRSFADQELSPSEVARFQEITTPGYERLGAPRVGHDSAADEWILRARNAVTIQEREAVLKDFEGYYVVRLVDCDGVPKFSNAGAYEGVDETSFRGSFLSDCEEVLSSELLKDAWNHKFPEQAVAYGNALVAAADAAERRGPVAVRQTLLSRLGLRKKRNSTPLSDQLVIVRSAGRWFRFWGERGHAIRAYF